MSRLLIPFLGIITYISCSTSRHLRLNNQEYKCITNRQVGESTLRFYNDSLFLLTRGGGLFYAKGTWRYSPGGKEVILKSHSHNYLNIGAYNGEGPAYGPFEGEKVAKLKNKHSILFEGNAYKLYKSSNLD